MNCIKSLKKIKNKFSLAFSKMRPDHNSTNIFNDIYRNKLWGESHHENRLFSGEGSHDLNLTEKYVKDLSSFLITLDSPSILDLGCGDFEVGSKLLLFAGKYIAADVSSLVVEQNKIMFSDSGVKFIQLDASVDELPIVDVIIIRQVLQHLSNYDIQNILNNINLSNAKYLCITEHLPIENNFTPNIDKPTSVGIRLSLGSGVDIEKSPFTFFSKSSSELSNIETVAEGLKSRLITTLYVLE